MDVENVSANVMSIQSHYGLRSPWITPVLLNIIQCCSLQSSLALAQELLALQEHGQDTIW